MHPSSLYDTSANSNFYMSRRSHVRPEDIYNDCHLANKLYSFTVASDRTTKDLNENIERNSGKNYEKQNYYIQQSPSDDEYPIKHNQEIQILPGPTITIINMAAERILDDPDWEEVDLFETQYAGSDDLLPNPKNNRLSSVKQVAARYITNDLLLIPQNVKYRTQLNIYIHQLDKYSSNLNKKALIKDRSPLSDNDSTSTEISGQDSETIHRFTPKNQVPVKNEDEYKRASIDEVEIKIKDLICLQKANNTFNDILSSVNRTHTSALSSSSTSQNPILTRS